MLAVTSGKGIFMLLKKSLRRLCIVFLMLAVSLPLMSIGVTAEEYKHEHQYREIDRIEPTCDRHGEIHLRCWICGEEYTDYIHELGHDFIKEMDFDNVLFGTITRTCGRCGKKFKFRKADYKEPDIPTVPPSKANAFENLSAEERAMVNEQQPKFEGKITGNTDMSKFIQHTGDDPYFLIKLDGICTMTDEEHGVYHYCQHIFVPETCTTWGYEVWYPCVKCGKAHSEIEKEYIEAHAKQLPDYPEYKEEALAKVYDFKYTEKPKGHDFEYYYQQEYSPAPSCTQPGMVVISCGNNCGESYAEYVPANGHTYRYEKSYLGSDDDVTEVRRVYCESCNDEPSATIAGFVKGSGDYIQKDKYKIVFTDKAGKTVDAVPLEQPYTGYFAELPAGEYTLNASAEGYDDRKYSVTVENGTILDFDVDFSKSESENERENSSGNNTAESSASANPDRRDSEKDTGFPIVPVAASAVGLAGVAGGAAYVIKRRAKK